MPSVMRFRLSGRRSLLQSALRRVCLGRLSRLGIPRLRLEPAGVPSSPAALSGSHRVVLAVLVGLRGSRESHGSRRLVGSRDGQPGVPGGTRPGVPGSRQVPGSARSQAALKGGAHGMSLMPAAGCVFQVLPGLVCVPAPRPCKEWFRALLSRAWQVFVACGNCAFLSQQECGSGEARELVRAVVNVLLSHFCF